MFHYFLRRTGYIFLKLYWDLLGLSSMITSTKIFFHECHSPQLWWEEGILGQILPIFVCQCFMFFFICWESFNIFSQNFYSCFWYKPEDHYTQKFFLHHVPPLLGIILGYFWAYFDKLFLISVKYFLMEFWADVVDVLLRVTALFFLFGGIFR